MLASQENMHQGYQHPRLGGAIGLAPQHIGLAVVTRWADMSVKSMCQVCS